jgi:endonuclease-3
MTKRELALGIYDTLYEKYGDCVCPLKHASPFQLLVAVMLSAQCRDDRVNLVTEKLFQLAPGAAEMAELPVGDIEEIIRPCGLSNTKSKNISLCAIEIRDKYNGQVPPDMDKLTALPGIGRKSANVVLGDAFNIPGFPVDTHVKRVLNRIGLVNCDQPEKIESIVNSLVPPEKWSNFSHLIIRHGRDVCNAAKPRCAQCPLADLCKYKGKK